MAMKSPLERLGNKVTATFISVGESVIAFIVDVMTWPFYKAFDLIFNDVEAKLNIGSYPGQNAAFKWGMDQHVWKAIFDDIKGLDGAPRLFAAAIFTIGSMTSYITAIFSLGGRTVAYQMNAILRNRFITADEAVMAYKRGNIGQGLMYDLGSSEGFDHDQMNIKESLTTVIPDPGLLRELVLRGHISESHAQEQLKYQGYTPEFASKLTQLFYTIPPIQDLITMSVREVFTPEVAERFGQFEDFPQEFANWAEKKGVSRQWALNYWAAHWRLPSVTQGFDMRHRGIIGDADLKLLLKSLDIMPFWRDKIIDLSFRPFTRVDVRRMYNLGILNFSQVITSYKDLGYSDVKANQMAEFTRSLQVETDAELTKADVLDGYKRRLLTKGDTRKYLVLMGFDDKSIDFFTARIDLKIVQDKKAAKLKGLKAKFVAGVITVNQARARLAGANVPGKEIDELIETWEIALDARDLAPSVSDLKGFLKDNIIDADDFRAELMIKGASPKYISWYIASVTPKSERRELNKTEILAAYRRRTFTEAQAIEMLKAIGYDDAAIGIILVEETRELSKADILAGYKRSIFTADEVTAKLSALGYDAASINFFIVRVDEELELEK